VTTDTKKRTARITLYSVGMALLVVVGVVWARQFVNGWDLPGAEVGLAVAGCACIWAASEISS
jgi:hypothetical protein